jgi:hypothetical protein
MYIQVHIYHKSAGLLHCDVCVYVCVCVCVWESVCVCVCVCVCVYMYMNINTTNARASSKSRARWWCVAYYALDEVLFIISGEMYKT